MCVCVCACVLQCILCYGRNEGGELLSAVITVHVFSLSGLTGLFFPLAS